MIINYDYCIVNFFTLTRSDTLVTVDVTDYEYDWDPTTGELILTKYVGSDSDIVTPEMMTSPSSLTVRATPSNATIILKYGGTTTVGTGSITVNNVPYGIIAIISVSANGYKTQNVPIAITKFTNEKNIVLEVESND